MAEPLLTPAAVESHTGGRFPCFEGIRACAALAVIVFHSVFLTSFFHTPGDIQRAVRSSGSRVPVVPE